jgi:hypothetical protein
MLDGGACVFLHRSLSSKLVTDYRTGEGRRRTILLSGKNKIKKEQVETKTQREEVRWTTNSPGSLDGHAPMRSSDSAHAPHFPFFFLIFYLLHIFDFINKIFF